MNIVAEPEQSTTTACPACGSSRVQFINQIASRNSGYGFTDGGKLFECEDCSLLHLENPALPPELDEMYEALPADLLPENFGRRDFDLALKCIHDARDAKSVLDVGCFRGDFLQLLPKSIEKFGIEPSREARETMAQRGIHLVGETIESADAKPGSFDFITMMDVAEHLRNPQAAIEKLAHWLKPGGKLIITTGDSDALPWRLSRASYWYYLPQHVSFCNRRWFEWAAHECGLRVTATVNFSHSRRAYGKMFVAERWKQFAKILTGAISQRVSGRRLFTECVGSATWPDHLFVVLQK